MSVSFYYNPDSEYPKTHLFCPGEKYPEYPFRDIDSSGKKNDVYEMIRNVFILHGLDSDNVNTRDWNPLGYAVKPGHTVLIKPNLVMHVNPAEKEHTRGMECMVTHPSVVRCVFDYVYIALKGRGKIIIADAPVQNCDFNTLLQSTEYGELFKFLLSFQSSDLSIEIADLRECVLVNSNGIQIQNINPDIKFQSTIVDLKEDSYFQDVKKKGRLRITRYVGSDTVIHHKKGKNEYCISDAALMADVIISLPKPKTHRIAGYTGALKNMIGINARKEYIPHHRKGLVRHGGDEYSNEHAFLKAVNSQINGWLNVTIKKQQLGMYKILNHMGRVTGRKIISKKNNREKNGMWYGNDTIWRSILDINKIILYADKTGTLQKSKQRKILSLGDMIVCGEKEGPLEPSYKYVGGILFSENPVLFDLFLVKVMGFQYENFKVLKNAMKAEKILKNDSYTVRSNVATFENSIFDPMDQFHFRPTEGWKKQLDPD